MGLDTYDQLCTAARHAANARGAALIILDGSLGSGFSTNTDDGDLLAHLPTMLRLMADQIEQDSRARASADPKEHGAHERA